MSDRTYFEYQSETQENPGSAADAVISELDASTAEITKENEAALENIDNLNTEEYINKYFGENWDGTFTDLTGIVEMYAQDMASQLQYNSSLLQYLKSNQSFIIDDALRISGIAQAQNNINLIQNEFDSLCSTITNFKTFGFSSGTSDIINVTGSSLDNLENIVNGLTGLETYADEITEFLKNTPEMVGQIGDYFSEKMEEISQFLTPDNLQKVIENLPEAVMNKFLGLDVVQDYMLMQTQIESSLTAIITVIKSIKAPTNLSSCLTLIKQLKSIVAEARLASDQIQRCTSILQGLQENLRNGNYIGFIVSTAGGLKFIEKPSTYAAKYPYNQAYTTVGGHIFETDNTPGHERLHVQHKSGTDIEIAPNGDTVLKVKNDFQTVVESNMESHSKGNQTIIVDKKVDFQASSIELSGSDSIKINSSNSIINSDTIGIISSDISIVSKSNLTLASNTGTSVSSIGPLFLTSESTIVLDAPSIIIGKEKTELITLNSLGLVNSVAKTSTNITSSDSTFISSGARLIQNAGLITLN